MKTDTKIRRNILLSKEVVCCDNLPMLVDMPETLTCQVCGKKFMNLVTGVQHSFTGVWTIHNNYQ